MVTILATTSVTALSSEPLPVAYQNQDRFIRTKIKEHLGNDPLMLVIAGCESTWDPLHIKHWEPDGSLVKNPTSSASGAFQVLLQYHGEWIASTELDMYDIDEYLTFVKILLSEQGYAAWNESKECWGPYEHLGTS